MEKCADIMFVFKIDDLSLLQVQSSKGPPPEVKN